MSLRSKLVNTNGAAHATCLSSNHKVMHYLQNSTSCSKPNSSVRLQNTSSNGNALFHPEETGMSRCDEPKDRSHFCSNNGSSSLMIEALLRSDVSLGSYLSESGGYYCNFSSNTSSSGGCSTFSNGGHEETASTSSEELDFNLAFDQTSVHADNEIANLNEIDEIDTDDCALPENEIQQKSNKNASDAATLRDITESNFDVHISELEEFLRKSYNSNEMDENEGFDHDNTITPGRSTYRACSPFLHDSTYTLCSQDRLSAYTNVENQENEHLMNGVVLHSNSLDIIQLNANSELLEKTPKKVVRFADVLGLDLESIRYMTPPDQSATSLIQECIRIKLEQLRLVKSQSLPYNPYEFPSMSNRYSSSPAKSARQYNLISKYFTSPINNIKLVYERQIILECLYTRDSIAYGTVRVHNLAYDKHVFARVTEDQWETFHDVYAWHSMNSSNDNTDTFTFEIRLGRYNDPTKVPKNIYFAVCLQIMGQEFWDNNQGCDYSLSVVERR